MSRLAAVIMVAERGVNGPDDLVIAPDGTIYRTEILAGDVGMLRPDGDFLVKPVGPARTRSPCPMTAAPSSPVIDVDAAVPTPEIVAEGFRVPGAVAFSPDGVQHAVDFAEGQVIRVDVDTGDRGRQRRRCPDRGCAPR